MKIAGRLDLAGLGLPDSGRFAILWHQIPKGSTSATGSHFDLLLQMEERLLTFQIVELPTQSERTGGTSILARRIADHRPLYLDYEGEISGNRGLVRQVSAGSYQLLPITAATPQSTTRVELVARKPDLPSEKATNSPDQATVGSEAENAEISAKDSAILVLPKCSPNENCEIWAERWTLPT